MNVKYRSVLLTILAALLLESGCSGIGYVGGEKSGTPTVGSGTAVNLGTPLGSYQILSGKESVTIPFEMFRSDIRMSARINGRDCHFLVDNGNLWDELLFFGSPKIDSLELEITGVTALGDTSVENPIYADVAEDITIAFGDLVFSGQTGIITRYIPGLPNPWEGADGQISAAFFKNFMVSINFDESRITLIKPEQFRYTGPGQAVTVHQGPLDSRTITAEVAIAEGSVLDLELLVDLGGIYPLYLPLGSDDRITLPEDAEEVVLGIGFGGPEQGYLGRINRLTIGNYTLENVLTAFTPMAENASVFGGTMVGMPLLQRFNLVFDYFHDHLYVEPNQSFNDPF
ncbi:hypothetical protein ACFL5M_04810 [Candidatus Neomarinimicrobiota bacterium]